MKRDFWTYLVKLLTDWQSLLSGAGSVVLAIIGAALNYSWSPLVFWPLAYTCLIYAGYRVWFKQVDDGNAALMAKQAVLDDREQTIGHLKARIIQLEMVPASLGDIKDLLHAVGLHGRHLIHTLQGTTEFRVKAVEILHGVLRDRRFKLFAEVHDNTPEFFNQLVNDSLRLSQDDVREDVPRERINAWKAELA